MKRFNKGIVLFIVLVMGVIMLYVSYGNGGQEKPEFKNVVLIGWDGVQREHLYEMLEKGELPNLADLIEKGQLVDLTVTTDRTQTKPGWAEILTGYSSDITGIYSNHDYQPIPAGYSIFERLEKHFRESDFVTVFIGGKINNIGARGPHVICSNCLTRYPGTFEKTKWWEEDTAAPARNPEEERIFEQREGEPYFYTKDSLDVYSVALGEAPNVGREVLEALEKYKGDSFFMFFHFEEPDEPGHRYGENSEEYSQGIITDDYWLGEIVVQLKALNIYKTTVIYVVTDHGFDENRKGHSNAPTTFFATNDRNIKAHKGDRKDITPTILEHFGVDLKSIHPLLEGGSLFRKQ